MLSGILGCDNLLDFGNETHLDSTPPKFNIAPEKW